MLKSPTTPNMQPLPGITHARFSLFRVRSPLLTESLLFSLPVGTEMFHFPTFPLPALYIQAGVTRSPCGAQRGFPIRKSSDQSSIISSPRLIADLYVLLRLQKPRHSPFALKNLMTKITQRSAFTVTEATEFANQLKTPRTPPRRQPEGLRQGFARVSKMLASTV